MIASHGMPARPFTRPSGERVVCKLHHLILRKSMPPKSFAPPTPVSGYLSLPAVSRSARLEPQLVLNHATTLPRRTPGSIGANVLYTVTFMQQLQLHPRQSFRVRLFIAS